MIKEAPAPKEIVQLLKCGCERTDAHTIGSRDHAKASLSSMYLVRHPRISKLIVNGHFSASFSCREEEWSSFNA